MVEKPVHKRTRAEREAERAEMVAKAAEEQASGRARSFRIKEQPSRGRGRGRVGRSTRATAQQTERDSSDGEPSAESEGHNSPLHDILATLARRQQWQKNRQRPSVAPDLGHEVDTSLSHLGGLPQQQ